ncbi:MAG TPA: squalene synthase HpnC [Pseudonocardiaceae bacterium]|jgi:squalene synthase HpnC
MAAIRGPGTTGRVLDRQRRNENFPVAMRLLPRNLRADLIAVYNVARVIDDLGDGGVSGSAAVRGPHERVADERVALLDDFRVDLAAVWDGRAPAHPVLRDLVPVVAARGLDRDPFDRLVQANLIDQHAHRYLTFAQLCEYCTLSADPVGRIVLAVFGAASPVTIEHSDRVCTALQLIEHCQDVAEDRRAGRIYLPQEDLAAFEVAEVELDLPVASPSLRRLMIFQIDRAAAMLHSGAPLVGLLHGWARLAVAGYVAGGRAALDALRRTHGDVLGGPPLPRRRDVARHLLSGALQGPPTRPSAVANGHQPGTGGRWEP